MDVIDKKTEQSSEVTEQTIKHCCQALLSAKEVKSREASLKELMQMSPVIKDRKVGVSVILATLVQIIRANLLGRDQVNQLLEAFELMPFFAPEAATSNASETWAEFFSIPTRTHTPAHSIRKALAYLKFIDQDDARFQKFKSQISLTVQWAYDTIKSPKPSKELLLVTLAFTDDPNTLPEFLRNESFDRRLIDFRKRDLDPPGEYLKDTHFTLSILRSKIKKGLLANPNFKESDFSTDFLDPLAMGEQLMQVIRYEIPQEQQVVAFNIKAGIEKSVRNGLGYDDIDPCVEIHQKVLSNKSNVLLIMIDLERLRQLWRKREQGERAVFVPPSSIDSPFKM